MARSSCFQDLGNCFEDCAEIDSWVGHTLCGLDCEVDLAACLADQVPVPERVGSDRGREQGGDGAVRTVETGQLTDVIRAVKELDDWDQLKEVKRRTREGRPE